MSREKGRANLAVIIFLCIFTFTAFAGLYHLPFYFPLVFLLALIIFIIAFAKTDVALVILIFSMLFSPEIGLGGVPGRSIVIRADDIFLIAVFLGWIAKMGFNKEFGLLRANSLNTPILTYIFISILATILGAMQGDLVLKHSVFYLLKYIEYFILFFMVANNLRDMKHLKFFLSLMLLVFFMVTVYGIFQHFSGVARISAPFEGEVGEPNTLGGYLLFMIAVTFGLFLYADTRKQKSILLILLCLSCPALLFTLSRGAWLGFFPMYLTLIIISKRFKRTLIAGLILLILFAPFVFPKQVKERAKYTFAQGQEYTFLGKRVVFEGSAAARIEVWRSSIEKWKQRPFLGYGVAGGGMVLLDTQYARVLVEGGTIGFVVFIWLLVTLFKIGWQSFQTSTGDNFAQGLSLGFTAGLVGLATQSLSAETFIIVRIMEPFWFLCALVVTLPELKSSAKKDSLLD